MREWHNTYWDQGLVVIGNHYPEFSHEKDLDNLTAALIELDVPYAVAQDNDGATWRAYNNRYWPTLYLIDKWGHIRYTHIGEGAYTDTESAIQSLLAESYPSTAAAEENTPAPPDAETMSGEANANVVHVRAVLAEDSSWTFHVTVEHPDTGWDDYADGWDVVTSEGTVLKVSPDDTFTRLLTHPHENEQPFTRSQSGIIIPVESIQVRVRAHDILDGFGGHEVLIDLETDSGPGYEIER